MSMGRGSIITITTMSVLFFFMLVALGMWGCPTYNVWRQTLSGKAALKRAEWDRQIKIKEAQAKKKAAQYEAEREVIRAHGVAKANKIIGQSLKGNEAYLRYLWIQGLQDGSSEVIYIPTEAGLPILEAGKRYLKPKPMKKGE